MQSFDVVIVGGGPAGATAAHDLAQAGRSVLLLDKAGRIKPCGGAIPPRLMRDFAIPVRLLCARATSARMVAPSERSVDMPIDGGFVGMVNRETFDEYLRERAAEAGAERRTGAFETFARDENDKTATISYRPAGGAAEERITVRAKVVIGADGARSEVARQALGDDGETPSVFAYHEIVRAPQTPVAQALSGYDPHRADVYYQGKVSPDFYGWVFPHGDTASVGVGSAEKGFSLRKATSALRAAAGLEDCETIRTEGAPIPLKPLKRWDDGRNVVLAGDAAGLVAPASGEGIYYAMASGRIAAEAASAALRTGDGRALAGARKSFMRAHGQVFFILGVMQHFWYRNDRRRERFVALCDDPDIQHLTWQAYMNKELVRAKPAAHVRIFFKDLGHLLSSATS